MRDPSIQGVSPHLYMTICPIQFETWLFRPHNIFSVIKIQSNDGVREWWQGAELSAAYSIMVHQMIYDCESPCQLRYFVQCIRWHLCMGLRPLLRKQQFLNKSAAISGNFERLSCVAILFCRQWCCSVKVFFRSYRLSEIWSFTENLIFAIHSGHDRVRKFKFHRYFGNAVSHHSCTDDLSLLKIT